MKNIYLIKDLSRRSGNSIHTIKYYIKVGILHEIGRSPETNFRYFDDSSLDMLQQIRRLRQEGKSISQIKNVVSIFEK